MSVPSSPPGPGSASRMEDPASGRTREILRRLELDIELRLDGLLHGDHRGLVPGHGSELGETRAYAPGDDVRRIDWNVSARLSEPHVRLTVAERELETWLVIDRSARIDFGTALCEKRDLALAAAAAAGLLTARDGNRIGAVLARPDADPETIPARGSRRHLLGILHTLASTPRHETPRSGHATDLTALLDRVGNVARRRGLIAVVSDFWVQPGWLDSLKVLSRRHQVIAIELVDQRELELPNVGLLPVVDPATGAVREVPTHKASVRRKYAQAATERREQLAVDLRTARVEHLALHTDRDWLTDLVRFLAARRQLSRSQLGGRV